MSLLPGEMTKQSLVTPASSKRSIRYSLTATGRSLSPSLRLPTGSSSLEKASGCMRLPRPAAGTIPHILRLRVSFRAARPARHRLGTCPPDQLFELAHAVHGGVASEHALSR